ncbi:MAG: xanthine dehydrogenase family protein subunit M [Nocardioidaceae bacterium]|nr:MAG: xanthine dehydrogenase family protein subunit M [Nocardioidaceae bacterium]
MKPAPFVLDTPTSVPEALDLLAEHGYDAKILAGGQSLVPMLNFRLVRPDHLIDINKLTELAYIRLEGDHLALGALTRQADVEDSALVDENAPLISMAIKNIAHRQIRNRGTVGGSLVHNDPSAEMPLTLLCLGAEVRLASVRGTRTVPVSEFILPWLATTAEADELLVEIRIPVQQSGTGIGFHELARRAGDFALAAAATTVRLAADGTVVEASLAACAARVAQKLPTAEAALVGQVPSDEVIAAAAAAAAGEVDPVADIHADADYRRHLVKVLTTRALRDAVDNAKEMK